MSFILDALKKSESERQRLHGPSTLDIPYGRPRSAQPLWMTLIVALLLVNLGLLVFFVLRKDEPTSAASEPTTTAPVPQAPAAATQTPVAAPPVPHENPAPQPASAPNASTEVRPLEREAYSEPATEEDLAVAEAPPPLPSNEPKLVRSVDAPPPPAVTGISAVNTLDAIGGSASLGLPDLHLDIHVYSTKPAERFVFINMRKYQEGQNLVEGPIVQRIASDGVILSHHGQQFLLPRQ